MNCLRCGVEVKEGSNFCQNCGQNLRPYQYPGYGNSGYYCPPYQGQPYGYSYPQYAERKDSILALIFALIIPGAGHMYAGEVKKGILILAVFVAIALVSGLVWFSIFWELGSGGSTLLASRPILFVLVIIGVVVWLYQIFDAFQAVDRFNAGQGPKPPY